MSSLAEATPRRAGLYYGWVNVAVAALAMVGTLPGRTQGIGLITERLLADFPLDRVAFAQINLWATLVGSLFCLGVGQLIDRVGSRTVLTAVSLLLGLVVLVMSEITDVVTLAILITLTRGLGQSALSVVSLTIVGRWFVRRLNLAMAIYSILLSIGFMIAFPLVGAFVQNPGWRHAWWGIGIALVVGLAPLGWLLVRQSPEACGLQPDGLAYPEEPDAVSGYTLREALATPAFWVFAAASAMYGLVASGIGLFNESILAERGFEASTYHESLAIVALTSLVGNFLGGWLTAKGSMTRFMALAMFLLLVALVALPQISTRTHVVLYAVLLGLAGGFVMVLFFSFWSHAYGRSHLGNIQGAAHVVTVLASAVGPLVLALGVERTGSYASVFYVLAAMVAGLGVAVWLVPLPRPKSEVFLGQHGK